MKNFISSINNLILAIALVFALAGNASAVLFTQTGDITIPATGSSGPASPFPSTINVTGVVGTITDVDVFLVGLRHTYPDDLDIWLRSPNGTIVLLMSDAGGSGNVSNIDLTFNDSATKNLPDSSQLTSGTYKPTNYYEADDFLSAFNGINANGLWGLFVFDDAGFDRGKLSGWSLDITSSGNTVPAPVPEPATFLLLGSGLLGCVAWARKRKTVLQ